jgi:hypothetical protein
VCGELQDLHLRQPHPDIIDTKGSTHIKPPVISMTMLGTIVSVKHPVEFQDLCDFIPDPAGMVFVVSTTTDSV